jgi:hypothetical protein
VYLGLPTAANVPVVYGSVIANPGSTGNVTLTPANATKLTFVAGRSVEQGSSSGSAAHGITIGGNASLPAGATYTVASAATVIGTLTIDEDAELLLAAGVLVDSATDTTNSHTGASSKVVLTGAASTNGASLAGEGVVKAGATTITGGASGSWQAVGASSTFAIAVDAITASAAAALTGTDDDGAITVEGGRLTVIGKIDVATKGTITLKADSGGTAGSLLLKGGTVAGNLLTNSSASNPVTIGAGATAANFLLYATADSGKVKAAAVTKADGTSAIATATGIVVQGTVDSSAGAALGNIGGGDAADTKDVLITSKTTAANALVIVNTDALKVIVPNS